MTNCPVADDGFTFDDLSDDSDFIQDMNPDSFVRLPRAVLEPSLSSAEAGARVQFERHGFFFAGAPS